VRVGIIGAAGFTGGELLRLLLLHPEVEITQATSREYAGEYIFKVHSNLRGVTTLQFSTLDITKTVEKCDIVFTATPHGTSVKITPKLLEGGLKVVDLSADFRLKNPEDYPQWYGWEHPRPDLLKKAVYGVPELHRQEIKESGFIACPGCMAISTILPAAPLLKAGLVEESHIVADLKIGSSGAGAKPSAASHHASRTGVVRPYKVVDHRHTAEIEQELGLVAGSKDVKVAMSAHAVNIVRGILSTVHLFLKKEVTMQEVWKAYRDMYRDEPFIRLVKDRKGIFRLPDPKVVIGSNYCDVGFELDPRIGRVVALGAIDNLIKGAAGIAVQCMNLMMGFDERTGLLQPPIYPV
jgi:N-acetyl-gamma-glutamyl-phosphate/LysW-gamma-L-alpha-aminoadipyl-6-phosphate reductase